MPERGWCDWSMKLITEHFWRGVENSQLACAKGETAQRGRELASEGVSPLLNLSSWCEQISTDVIVRGPGFNDSSSLFFHAI